MAVIKFLVISFGVSVMMQMLSSCSYKRCIENEPDIKPLL